MAEEEYGAQRRREIRDVARSSRAAAQRLRDDTVLQRQRSRALAALMSKRDAGGAGRRAFAALPVAAALLDASGRVLAVNGAWRRLPAVREVAAIGAKFGTEWTALTGDGFVEGALPVVARTGAPVQAESTLAGLKPYRFLVQMGPADLGEHRYRGILVVLVDVTSQYDREQQLLYEATHDTLTGLANRAWLQRAVEEGLERLRRYDERFALVYLDLDAFKPLNDRYGHAVGDAVLRGVADRWQRLVRAPDLLARIGGDEFVVVVSHADPDDVAALVARLRAALAEPFDVTGRSVSVSATAGVAIPAASMSAEDAVALADQAMYRQKRRG